MAQIKRAVINLEAGIKTPDETRCEAFLLMLLNDASYFGINK